MKKAVIFIDCQNDFFNGSLPCGESAQKIRPALAEHLRATLEANHQVVFTLDTHVHTRYIDTVEGEIFPIHCVKDTDGWQIIDELMDVLAKNDREDKSVYIEKDTYLSFALMAYLAKNGFDEIEFCGLATNVCVFHNVVIIRNAFPEAHIVVNEGLCASYDDKLHSQAIGFMEGFGCEIVKGRSERTTKK